MGSWRVSAYLITWKEASAISPPQTLSTGNTFYVANPPLFPLPQHHTHPQDRLATALSCESIPSPSHSSIFSFLSLRVGIVLHLYACQPAVFCAATSTATRFPGFARGSELVTRTTHCNNTAI